MNAAEEILEIKKRIAEMTSDDEIDDLLESVEDEEIRSLLVDLSNYSNICGKSFPIIIDLFGANARFRREISRARESAAGYFLHGDKEEQVLAMLMLVSYGASLMAGLIYSDKVELIPEDEGDGPAFY